jgi:hypothetical protein
MNQLHLITPEFPPSPGGVSEHSRVVAQAAADRGLDVHVWTSGEGTAAEGIHLHATLGAFGADDLAATDRALDAFPAPRSILLQWVPHGFGHRGMNFAFARWIARRAAGGDRVDVMVHEPFADFVGGSWIQPVRAAVQRAMTRAVVGSARRVWLSIPGWEARLLPMLRPNVTPRVLPVPGPIPVARDRAAVDALRGRLLAGSTFLAGYFGAGSSYVESALKHVCADLEVRRPDVRLVLIGRGTTELAKRLGCSTAMATGLLDARALSHHLQACDVLLQPYVDGVSGRRTTTVSALEHGVPVATTFGRLSEPFWRETAAVETVAAESPGLLSAAVEKLLLTERNAEARTAATILYAARFDPRVALEPLFTG